MSGNTCRAGRSVDHAAAPRSAPATLGAKLRRFSTFAQLIRCRVKPDAWGRLRDSDERWQRVQAPVAPGSKGAYILREADAPERCVMVVLFDSRELARRNSDRPETNACIGSSPP